MGFLSLLFYFIFLSFYSPEKIVAYSRFVPRIKIPPRRTRISNSHCTISSTQKSKLPTDIAQESILSGNNGITEEVDYDAYDNDVFILPSSHFARYLLVFLSVIYSFYPLLILQSISFSSYLQYI